MITKDSTVKDVFDALYHADVEGMIGAGYVARDLFYAIDKLNTGSLSPTSQADALGVYESFIEARQRHAVQDHK